AFRAPFPRPAKLAVACSFPILYEYAVIARSYALSTLLLFAIATCYPRRREKPFALGALLGLLFDTNVHSMALAVPILGIWLGDLIRSARPRPGREWAGAALAAIGGTLALIQLLPPPDGQLQGLSAQAGLRWVRV